MRLMPLLTPVAEAGHRLVDQRMQRDHRAGRAPH
jgi:hypothetical protein